MISGMSDGGMGLGSTTHVCVLAHQEYVRFDIFLVTLYGLRQYRIILFGVGVTATAEKCHYIYAYNIRLCCVTEYNE